MSGREPARQPCECQVASHPALHRLGQSPPACASRQAPASRGAGSILFLYALVRCSDGASRSPAKTFADRRGPYQPWSRFPESRWTAGFRSEENYFATPLWGFLLSRLRAIAREPSWKPRQIAGCENVATRGGPTG